MTGVLKHDTNHLMDGFTINYRHIKNYANLINYWCMIKSATKVYTLCNLIKPTPSISLHGQLCMKYLATCIHARPVLPFLVTIIMASSKLII